MNHEAPQSVQRSNYWLGRDRFNVHGIEARHMPYPYLWCRQAKSAYMRGFKDAFNDSEDREGRGEC